MAQLKTSITTRLVLIAVAILTAGPAIADKPSWAGGGKHEKHVPCHVGFYLLVTYEDDVWYCWYRCAYLENNHRRLQCVYPAWIWKFFIRLSMPGSAVESSKKWIGGIFKHWDAPVYRHHIAISFRHSALHSQPTPPQSIRVSDLKQGRCRLLFWMACMSSISELMHSGFSTPIDFANCCRPEIVIPPSSLDTERYNATSIF